MLWGRGNYIHFFIEREKGERNEIQEYDHGIMETIDFCHLHDLALYLY